jgi:hypothetical protein
MNVVVLMLWQRHLDFENLVLLLLFEVLAERDSKRSNY